MQVQGMDERHLASERNGAHFQPSTESNVDVSWIVGSDVLNMDPSDRSSDQQRIAEEMLARRDRVALL